MRSWCLFTYSIVSWERETLNSRSLASFRQSRIYPRCAGVADICAVAMPNPPTLCLSAMSSRARRKSLSERMSSIACCPYLVKALSVHVCLFPCVSCSFWLITLFGSIVPNSCWVFCCSTAFLAFFPLRLFFFGSCVVCAGSFTSLTFSCRYVYSESLLHICSVAT